MIVHMTHIPGKPKHMLYIGEYKEEENNLIIFAAYNCKKDVLRFRYVKDNPLIKYASLLTEYCLQERVQEKGVCMDIRI